MICHGGFVVPFGIGLLDASPLHPGRSKQQMPLKRSGHHAARPPHAAFYIILNIPNLLHVRVRVKRWRGVPQVAVIVYYFINARRRRKCAFFSQRLRAVMMELFIDQAISRVYSCRLNQIHNHMGSFLRCDILRASGLKSKRPHPSCHLDKIHRGARSTSDWIEDMFLALVRL